MRTVTADRQDDVSGLLPRLDVAGRLDHVLQRVGPVDDGSHLARFDQAAESFEVAATLWADPSGIRNAAVRGISGHFRRQESACEPLWLPHLRLVNFISRHD